MATGVQYAGEYKLETCELISSAGVVTDISGIIVEVNLFEDMFKPTLTGSILISDTNNLVDNMPIIGQEYISLKIITPGLTETEIDFTENIFCVYELGGRTKASNNSSEVVELKLCSPELLRNYRTRVSQSFEQTIDKIIESILQDAKYLDTRKDIYIEETSGIRKIVSPNYHPFDLITRLTRESMGLQGNNPHFLFFENLHGFHFRSLQSLYSEQVQGEYSYGDSGIDKHTNTTKGIDGRIPQAYRRILQFQTPTKNNSLADITGGMLGSTLIMHDVYNKKYHKTTFNYFQDHDTYSRLETVDGNYAPRKYNPILIDDENTVGDFTNAKIHLHPTSTTIDGKDSQFITVPPTAEQGNKDYMSNRADIWLLQRKQRFHELNRGMTVNMSIHGNTAVATGQVIKVHVPVTGTDHENTGESKYESGLYLISKLRHTFSQPTKTHLISLQATKDSYPYDFESVASGKQPKPSDSSRIYQIQAS